MANEMTVGELIDLLQKVENKEKVVKLAVNATVTRHFHLNDKFSDKLYLSNQSEEGYVEPKITDL